MPLRRHAGTALERASALLARRPLTRHEVLASLAANGFEAAEAEAAVERLTAAGIVDDGRLASHYLRTRSERLGHGADRLIRELVRRGVDPGIAERAWGEIVEAGDLDPAELLAREASRRARAEGGRLDRRGYARVYNALLRAGFEREDVEAALERYRSGLDD